MIMEMFLTAVIESFFVHITSAKIKKIGHIFPVDGRGKSTAIMQRS